MIKAMALALTAIGMLAAAGGTHAAEKTAAGLPLQQMDVFSLERASDVQISPDGRQVAYVRITPDVRTDRSARSIWIVDVASGAQRRLAGPSAGNPRWSPDGGRIAYVGQDAAGNGQLYVADARPGGRARPLTSGGDAPGAFSWSRDGTRIAFLRSVAQPAEGLPVEMPPMPAGARWSDPPRVVMTPYYSADGKGFVTATRSRLFVVAAAGTTARELPVGALDVSGSPQWSADGVALLFVASPSVTASTEAGGLRATSLYEIGLASGGPRRLTSDRFVVSHASVSRDGRSVAYLRHDPGGMIWQDELWVMDRDGQHARRQRASPDRLVNAIAWTADGRLAFSYGDRGETSIAAAPLDGPATVLVRHAEGDDFSLADDGTVAFASGAADRPPEAGIATPPGAERVLTSLNARLLATRTLARVEPFDAPSAFDGQNVPGFAMLPPGYVAGRRYPTVLYIHGGPWGDEGPQWHLDLQLMAAAGYVVLYSNPRGSTSYGSAYMNQLSHAAPQHDYDDLMGVVDAAVSRGLADPARLYVTGSSYGAEMTTWIVGRTDRFRAAVAEKPSVNFAAANLQNDQYHAIVLDARGLPWEHPDAWWRSSPISNVGRVKTPTMLIVGEDDRRTPPGESQQFYNALQLRHVPTALVLYPGASHETLGGPRSQMLSETAYTLAWFARYR